MYIIRPETKDTLWSFMDAIQPDWEEIEKVEALKRVYEGLRLHELPLAFALFVFDLALKDFKKGLEIRKILGDHKNRHWLEAIRWRVKNIGEEGLLKVLNFIIDGIPVKRRYEL